MMDLMGPLWIVLGVVAAIAAVLGVIMLIVHSFNKDMTTAGPRTTAGAGNMFGGLTEVFDPGAHRAQLEFEKLKNQAVTVPNPTGDDPRRSSVIKDRYGNPIGFRVAPTTGNGPDEADRADTGK